MSLLIRNQPGNQDRTRNAIFSTLCFTTILLLTELSDTNSREGVRWKGIERGFRDELDQAGIEDFCFLDLCRTFDTIAVESERQASEHYLVEKHGLAVSRACSALRISRITWYQQPNRGSRDDDELKDRLNQTVEKYPRRGFWKCYDYLRLNGFGWNHTGVWRVNRKLKLNLPRPVKRRRLRERVEMEIKGEVNRSWSLDFRQEVL